MRTDYRWVLSMDDIGEYDTVFMARVAEAITSLLVEMGGTGTGFTLAVVRSRPEDREPPPNPGRTSP